MQYKFNVKGKRGGILGSALSNFWAYIIFVLVIIIFFVFFKIQSLMVIENKITDLESKTNAIMLLNYLRTPVEIDGDEMNMVDLINLCYHDNNYKNILMEETKKILNSFGKPIAVSGWNLNIYIMPEDETMIEIKTLDILGFYEKRISFVDIPISNNPERYLKLKLYLECQDDISC